MQTLQLPAPEEKVVMLNYVSWDIETVAHSKSKAHFDSKKYEAPKNWKDPEKIADYVQAARHEDVQKAALHWWTGQVVCVTVRPLNGKYPTKTFVGADEKQLLTALFDFLADAGRTAQPCIIGKSSDVFDKPFIIGRALAHDMGILQCLRGWKPINDVDEIFGFGSRAGQRGSLNDYAHGLGLSGKTGHGSDVQGWWDSYILGDASSLTKIASYCADDTDIVHELLKRWLKPYPLEAAIIAGEARTTPEDRKTLPPIDVPFAPTPAPTPTTSVAQDAGLCLQEF